MSRYGIDYYGLAYYGSDNPISYSANPFIATPSKQGQITLQWTTPTGSWSRIALVRNPYGYPLDPWDGTRLFTSYNGSSPTSYVDNGQDTAQTYTITNRVILNKSATLTTSTTHALKVGQSVFVSGVGISFDGTYTIKSVTSTTFSYEVNVSDIPSAASSGTAVATSLVQGQYYYYSIFVYSLVQYKWLSAGTAFALSVADCKNTTRLYEYLPNVYRISAPYSPTTADWQNPRLYAFLSNFGFELDYEQTMVDLLKLKYNTQKVNGRLVPTMMNQFGQTYEPAIGLQQNRVILRDSVTLNKQKGSKDGLVAYIKDFTGWGVPQPIAGTPNPSVNGVVIGNNLMLDYNDSSFEEGTGNWISSDGTADLDHLRVAPITQVQLVSNVATVYIGPHYYEVGNEVFISGLPQPLFNSITAYTITSINSASSVSFSLTGTDVPLSSGYNPDTNAYGTLTPSPSPWVEPTAPALFPNKTKGVLAVSNLSTSSQTVTAFIGDDSPITKGIPVTAGLQYTFSIYSSKGSFTARNVTANIKWFNRFGAALTTSSGTAVSDNVTQFGSGSRPFVTATAPSGAYYACPGVSIAAVDGTASNEHHYFDAAEFEQAAAPSSFEDARQIKLTLRANRINELINPNFVTAATPWTATGATTSIITQFAEPNVETFSILSAQIATNVATVTLNNPHSYQVGQTVFISGVTGANAGNYNGTRTITAPVTLNTFTYSVTAGNSSVTSGTVYKTAHGLQLTASATGTAVLRSWDGATAAQRMGIYYPSTSYTFSIYVRPSTATETIIPKILWYNSAGTNTSTDTGSSFSCPTTGWTRVSVTATAPSTAHTATVQLDWSTATTGDVIVVDQALFENNGLVLEYFDGSTGPGGFYDLMWEGNVVNGARSHLYKNRFAVQTRLIESALTDFLPLGSTASVFLAQPKT